MKRSRIGPKTYEEALAKTRLKPGRKRHGEPRECQQDGADGEVCGFTAYSSQGMGIHQRRAHGLPTRHKRLGPGKKSKAWTSVWRWLKAEFEKRGRTKCEFHFIAHKCSETLTPAHSKKRRMIQGDEIYHVAIACMTVHQILDETMSHADMEAAVIRAINENGGLILPK